MRSRFCPRPGERGATRQRDSDTLAQGFVGISSQLDAVAMCMLEDAEAAGRHLDLARKMARYSLTEAAAPSIDPAGILARWTGSGGRAAVGKRNCGRRARESKSRWTLPGSRTGVPRDMEHEPVANRAGGPSPTCLKHAGASKIWVLPAYGGAAVCTSGSPTMARLRAVQYFLGSWRPLRTDRDARAGPSGSVANCASKTQPGSGTKVEVTAPLP